GFITPDDPDALAGKTNQQIAVLAGTEPVTGIERARFDTQRIGAQQHVAESHAIERYRVPAALVCKIIEAAAAYPGWGIRRQPRLNRRENPVSGVRCCRLEQLLQPALRCPLVVVDERPPVAIGEADGPLARHGDVTLRLDVINDDERYTGCAHLLDRGSGAASQVVVDHYHLIRQAALPRQILEYGSQALGAAISGDADADFHFEACS